MWSRGVPQLFREVGVHAQHVVVAVHGDEEFRLDLLVDPRGFAAVAVAGGVHVARCGT